MTIRNSFPDVRPALNLDFANTKRLDPRITFTRSSTGTYVDEFGVIKTAASNEARFDHDGDGNSLGLLIEESRTNYKTISTTLNPSFVFTNTISPAPSATIVAPDGVSQTVEKLVEDTSTGTHNGALQFSGVYDNWATSFFVKAAGRTRFKFDPRETGSFTEFDLASGTVNGVVDSSRFEQLPNGWFRVKNFTVASFRAFSRWRLLDASGNESYTGDGVSGIYLWGFQWERAATFSTSYIPTTGSTATRSADVASISNAFSTTAFTIINEPFGSASGSDTLQILGAGSTPIRKTSVYDRNLTQTQINAVASVTDEFWRWRVFGSSFALPNSYAGGYGQVTVDWGDGTVETLTTSEHTFSNGGGYHDIGFRLDSGTFFRPNVSNDATHKTKVVAVGPAPASMIIYGQNAFYGCSNLNAVDPTAVLTGNGSLGWYKCSSLTTFPLIDTSSVTNLYFTWRDCTSLTSFPAIDTSNVTDFTNTWTSCTSLTSFPLIDVSSGGSKFNYTWQNCSSLTSFPLLDFSACTSFTYTWTNCNSLTSFPLINTSSVTSFNAAWYNCTGLTSFPQLDTSSGTNFTSAWYNCSSLTSFPLIDTSSATSLNSTWRGCSSLTSFPAIDSSNVTNFSIAWYGCGGLTSFPALDTSNGTNFYTAWFGCGSLTSFPVIDTSQGQNMSYAWYACSSLTSFPNLDFSSATTFLYTWLFCTNLANVPAGLFDTTAATNFTNAFGSCALTAQSVENILVSIDTANQSNGTLGISGGTNAGYSTWSSAAQTALSNLQGKGWTVYYNP